MKIRMSFGKFKTACLAVVMCAGVAVIVLDIVLLSGAVSSLTSGNTTLAAVSLAAGALVTVFAALIAFNSYYRFDDDELVSVIGFFVDRADYETADAIFVNNESKEIFLRYTPEGKAPVTVRFNITPSRSAELLALLEKKCAFARVEFFDPPAKKQPPEKK